MPGRRSARAFGAPRSASSQGDVVVDGRQYWRCLGVRVTEVSSSSSAASRRHGSRPLLAPVAPPTLTPHPNQEGWGTRSGHAGHGTLVLASFIIVGMSEAQTCLHGHVGTREAERERDTAEQWRLPLPPRRGAQLSWHTRLAAVAVVN